MNISLKLLLGILLISFVWVNSYSQTDSTKIKRIDNEINETNSTNQLKAKSLNTRINPTTQFDLNIDKKINTTAINENLNKNKSNNNQNFLLEKLPENSDIIGLKYKNGKDITNQKLASNFSLGTINSNTKTVKIECRDYSYVDGDRIRIYINEQVVSDNIGLKGNYYVYYAILEKGYNRIDFQALNQGFSGPNTAELTLYDANGTILSSKEWNLQTGETATLGVIFK